MRTIKFRALKDDMSNCKWVYGQLVYDAIGRPRITVIDDSGKGLTFHTCLNNTEGQFTGLLDKNGSEIYEGDLIQDRFGAISKIVYVEDLAGFRDLSKIGYTLINQGILNNENVKVIGNVYENPELL